MTDAIPVTAIVSSHNEAHLLPRCLDSLAFCDELIVIDIDSTDETDAVATAHGARVIRHPWVPIAERARMNLVGEARHHWLLFLDPDEVFASDLAEQLRTLLPSLSSDVAVLDCPWQFYFRSRPLRGTVWGGVKRKRTLVRRGAAELMPTVHSGTGPRPGYRTESVAFDGANAIAHYWATGYAQLLGKHWRYVKLEGPDQMERGVVTGYRDVLETPLAAFWQSFVRRRGYRDGATGFLLSVLWSAYSTAAKLSLLRALRRGASASADAA